MKILTKQPNLTMFRMECDDTPGSNYGTLRLFCYDMCIYHHKETLKNSFVRIQPNDMVRTIIENDLRDSPLKDRLLQALSYTNIPTREEINELLILYKLAT